MNLARCMRTRPRRTGIPVRICDDGRRKEDASICQNKRRMGLVFLSNIILLKLYIVMNWYISTYIRPCKCL